MAKQKLTMMTLTGKSEMLDLALQSCIINREIHLENAITAMNTVRRLVPFDTNNPYAEILQSAYKLCSQLGIEPEYADFSSKGYTVESTESYFKSFLSQFESLNEQIETDRERVENTRAVIIQLRNFQGVDEQLLDMFEMKYVKFRFGMIPLEDYDDFYDVIQSREDVFYFHTVDHDGWAYGIYFALPGIADLIDSVLASIGFQRIRISKDVPLIGTGKESISALEAQNAKAEREIAELEQYIKALIDNERSEVLARYSNIRFLSETYVLRAYAGQKNGRFYLVGWLPEEDAEQYAMECEKINGFSCVLTNAKDLRHISPPIKMISNCLSKIFRPFVDMYGLPTYGETDPSMFMSITYILFFGIMFGDVGQGAVLSLIGLLMWKKKNMWLGRVLSCVGLASIAFGFVYGSIFGYEHILPGFKVLEEGNVMRMLLAAATIGVLMILICMVMNIINGIHQKNIRKTFFSPNGAAGFVLYAGVALGGVLLAGFGINIFTPVFIICVIVLPLLLIMSAEPLGKLAERKKDWRPSSIGGFIVEGFFELFETILSYISNTISFLRIGAFAISHAGMMLVVFLLADDGNNIIGVIVGNLIVIGIEATLVCIQVMRLEFYEMFGRFYVSGGRRFTPNIIEYSK